MTDVQAYAAARAGSPLEPTAVRLGPIRPDDVEVEVEACSLCHSDLHLLDDDWGISKFPLVVGHEIVGRIVALGAQVTGLGVGDRVGIGWQCGACGACVACVSGQENLCIADKRRTCVDQHGGLAERVRADRRFAFKLPEGMSPDVAAPLLCAGVTVFAPLRRHGVGPGSRVGVIGLGGLGHLAVQFASKMGADVTAFDPDAGKGEEAKSFGARELCNVDDATLARLATPGGRFDVLLSTTHADLEWNRWMALLTLGGTLCLTGVPSRPLTIAIDHLIDGQRKLTGSAIGSPADMRAMLAFAAEHGVRPRIERRPFGAVNEALADLRGGRARYRIVLTEKA